MFRIENNVLFIDTGDHQEGVMIGGLNHLTGDDREIALYTISGLNSMYLELLVTTPGYKDLLAEQKVAMWERAVDLSTRTQIYYEEQCPDRDQNE